MKKASLIIQDIQNNVYQDILLDIYVDQEQLEHQKTRYIQAIEKFIVHQEEVKSVEIIQIINTVKF